EKAKKRAEKVPNRGYYFDLLAIYEYIQNKNYQYPSTPSLSHMFALNFQLKKILNEGLDNRFKRHEDMANLVRDWAQEHFQIFTDVNYLSNTLTVINNTQGISVSNLNKKLQERGFLIANGYGDLKEKTFRISHMGDYTVKDVNDLLTNINEILGF
ncbi:alanine--glyoxylate aminotransferase family protein, partial [Clostridioides difficile]|nr:alanine--glyoxylate aminotransferase family protein [Clostridioides difficile]